MKRTLTIVFIYLIILSCSKEKLTQKSVFDYRFGLSSSVLSIGKVNTVRIDGNGVKWFTTEHQLISYNNSQWNIYNALDTANHVNDIFPYNNNNLWMGLTQGAITMSTGSGVIQNSTLYNESNSTLSSDIVNKVTVGNNGIAWFASAFSPCYLRNNKWDTIPYFSSNYPLHNFFQVYPITGFGVHGDTCYASTNGAGVARFVYGANDVDGVTGASSYQNFGPCPIPNNVNCVYVDSSSNKWYGSQSGLIYHPSLKFESQWLTYNNTSNGLINNNVLTITKDKNNTLWIGTAAGISTFNLSTINNPVFNNYTTSNGLSDNNINSLAVDIDGSIWAATNNGISHFKNNTWTAIKSIN